ncbi:hypothetical protein [Paracoccus sp. (in: a-proteobacteria)]|uniref:hypothetical protein n=1 Tax=Paracoccus sp. TaxID=267 RepID=UPI00289D8E84|nr:hypothetical protein [Paracoccus sp. (in: a-proteobacteria)]
MIDLLLIVGSGLCVASIVMAIIAVARTQAPRSAAIALMMGVLLLLLGAKSDPAAVNPENMLGAWKRLFAGQVSLSVPVEAPSVPAPDVAPAVDGGASGAANTPATDTPATSAPAAATSSQ